MGNARLNENQKIQVFHASQGLGIDYSIAYREDLLLDRITEIMDFLPGASTGNKMDIMDALEYEEDWEMPD